MTKRNKEEIEFKKTKEYAVQNKCFSLNVGGGYYTPTGEFLKTPSGVSRRNTSKYDKAWKVFHDRKLYLVHDSEHDGDYKKSLEHAIALKKKLAGELVKYKKENRNRKTQTGENNITIVYRKPYIASCGRKKGDYYSFAVCVGDHQKLFYIGTTSTYSTNYEAKLAIAVKYRDDYIQSRKESVRFE